MQQTEPKYIELSDEQFKEFMAQLKNHASEPVREETCHNLHDPVVEIENSSANIHEPTVKVVNDAKVKFVKRQVSFSTCFNAHSAT